MLEKLEPLIVEKILGKEALTQYQLGKIAKKYFEPYLPEILKLSQNYNFTGNNLTTSLETERSLYAYLLYFFPINYFKICYLLNRLNLNFTNPKMLDFGCGPGTASFAALSYFDNPEIFLYDISEQAAKLSKDFIKSFKPGTKCHLPGKKVFEAEYDLIIAANSLNEIKENERFDVAGKIISSLKKDGILLILEPALKEKTREAMHLRDQILKKFSDLSVVFPCTHNNDCPMLKDSDEDWCHSYISWQGSKLVNQIDELTGFNKHRLKYSSLAFKNGENINAGYRVVSFPKKGKTGISLQLCGEGSLRKQTFAKKDIKYKSILRADIFDKITDLT